MQRDGKERKARNKYTTEEGEGRQDPEQAGDPELGSGDLQPAMTISRPPASELLNVLLNNPSVIAYAACCQLDSEDRPIAGTIVYCAQHLTSPSLSHSDIVMVTAA
ncbi:hypothetical protein P7K49_017824 [Saguinus oedipus]|uniref:Uncharacterized protein n=1 Tax=Saguinus oedipus TaxID=9490 RepID=A0ABQ9V3L8_SAGOE|nr:hypothetical protein P7K49_017824 [Saguinus oedipus]